MPVTPTYPGVYIEEIPSGVRTITGVATSIAAFVGRTSYGPENDPVTIFSFADFERGFGGLQADLPMTYAVRDFYLNGGRQAIIVRLYRKPDSATEDGSATYTTGGLTLKAATPGAWGNRLSVKIDYNDIDDSIDAEFKRRYSLPDEVTADYFFNLTVVNGPPDGPCERMRNVSLHEAAGSRRIDRVLEQESNLLRFSGDLPDDQTRPSETTSEADPTRRDNFASGKAASVVMFGDGVDSDLLTATEYGVPDGDGNTVPKSGINALDKTDLFNLLCIPPDTRPDDPQDMTQIYSLALQYCADHRAMLIVDSPSTWSKNSDSANYAKGHLSDLQLTGAAARNGVLYFPRVRQADPLREGQLDTFAPCGIIAGVYARTDRERGVWKAPAGLDASINGIQALQVNLTDDENGLLNPLGINCLRFFQAGGHVVWGARTLRGSDQLADEYKYVPVRRTALFIEQSLYRGTQWVVFEPNDEPLWAQIRLNVGAFMHNLFRQGAFQGKTPREAYFVKCDSETTTQTDINLGIVNILVGFAPLKPAEFVVIKLQQMAGQIAV